MIKSFFTKNFRRKVAQAESVKRRNAIEKLGAVIVLATTAVTRAAKIKEQNDIMKGWQTIEVGRFHPDESCEPNMLGNRGYYTYETIVVDKPNLLTNAGRDFLHLQGYTNTSAGTRGAGFMVVSENATGADASHTTVAGEILINGLARADADTKSHTTGTNVSTIEHTYTASGVFTAVQLSGLLNAASVGTLLNENTFTAVALQINDTLKVTWTITMG